AIPEIPFESRSWHPVRSLRASASPSGQCLGGVGETAELLPVHSTPPQPSSCPAGWPAAWRFRSGTRGDRPRLESGLSRGGGIEPCHLGAHLWHDCNHFSKVFMFNGVRLLSPAGLGQMARYSDLWASATGGFRATKITRVALAGPFAVRQMKVLRRRVT